MNRSKNNLDKRDALNTMLKTFKYRLRPTHKQATVLGTTLQECRWLYNHFLEERKNAWEQEQKSLGYYQQAIKLPILKNEREALECVYSQVLQNVAVRIDLAFKAFFRRAKAGEKPGYPRFRGRDRYNSITYPQSGWRVDERGLHLSKIGCVRMVRHRELEGTPKTVTISRTSTGKWFAAISCEIESTPSLASNEMVGIDVGLASFATLSTGDKIPNPRFFRTDEKALAKAQRRMSKEEKGTPERKNRRKPVARIHERISNRRNDFAHQASRKLVNRFGIIAVEDLNVNRMVHNHCLAKSISDAAWTQFTQCLSYKAEYAGRKVVFVNPAYTSQDCSACGHRVPKNLSDRIHRCPCCGLVMDRDENAANNILALGLQSLGLSKEAVRFS
jgi:putative transposase